MKGCSYERLKVEIFKTNSYNWTSFACSVIIDSSFRKLKRYVYVHACMCVFIYVYTSIYIYEYIKSLLAAFGYS